VGQAAQGGPCRNPGHDLKNEHSNLSENVVSLSLMKLRQSIDQLWFQFVMQDFPAIRLTKLWGIDILLL
jgi:hypothetical protein